MFPSFFNVNSPVLSHESGFYKDDFYLKISTNDNYTIHYTTDGSTPDENSPVYTEPMLISDASKNSNNYCNITDITAYFNYSPPNFNIDKCTCIQAIAINKMGIKSNVSSATYFVGISPEKYPECNIISITTAPSNLFDYNSGIYMLGAVYDNYMANTEDPVESYDRPANYKQRGMEWEREANFKFFNTEGQLLTDKNVGIRIRGASSRAHAKKGLNVFSRPNYDGTDSFEFALFGNEYIPQSISIMTDGNQIYNQFPDWALSKSAYDLNFSVAQHEPCVMFINGEYWGFFWMAEKFDETYLSYHYDVSPDNVIMIKGRSVQAGDESNINLYNSMVSFITKNDMSDPNNYAKACEMIDINSFIDYHSALIYLARCADWPSTSNTALWRTVKTGPQEYEDGKWRWMAFDMNTASMGLSIGKFDHDTLTTALDKSSLLESLWANSSFRESFEDRILYMANEVFTTERMIELIDYHYSHYYPALQESWNRWFAAYGGSARISNVYESDMNNVRYFFENRKPYVESWFDN